MKTLIENNILTEIECGSNFAYLLNDNNLFLSTEYKVLQNQENSSFVKCMKMLLNGKVELYYLTSSFKPLSLLLTNIDADGFLKIVGNLFANILSAKSIGFLSCQNINISFDKIYVDKNTYKVNLVYLPLSVNLYEDYSAFENELRTNLIRVISKYPNLYSVKTEKFASDLSNGIYTLEDLYEQLKRIISLDVADVEKPIKKNNPPVNQKEVMHIIALQAPVRVDIVVNKDEFILGKKESAVDGCISFNKMISRVHCKICKRGNVYTITDLESANGTYVNNTRLISNKAFIIKDGDIIRLANSDFKVKFS